MEQSTLPRDLEVITVGRMEVGEVGYVAPDAIHVGLDRAMWIMNVAVPRETPDAYSHVRIERVQAGVRVYKNTILNYRYTLEREKRFQMGFLPVTLVESEP